MPRYANGFIPESALVIFNRGWNSDDGSWYWGLPAATYQKHINLRRVAASRTGRWLDISDGWGAYRPYAAQVRAREIYGNGAAWPGTSSHGGWWENRDTAAMDYSNWGWVYSYNRDAFYADCRAVGLTPGMISPQRGYPDEPWHVIDLDPWAATPAGGGGGSVPFPTPLEEEPQMTRYYLAGNDTALVRNGNIYADDGPDGSFRGVTNLEGFFLTQPITNGGVRYQTISGAGLELLFALKGVCEQPETPAGQFWIDAAGNRVPLAGLGAPTGRVFFPGSQQPVDVNNPTGTKLGEWHYPNAS